MRKKQIIIFSDLDGTLLDKNTFRFDEIRDYFNQLISDGIIIIPNSSKTEAELLDFNKEYKLKLCCISENGSSIIGLNHIHKKLPGKMKLSRSLNEISDIYNKNISLDYKKKISFILQFSKEKQKRIFGLSSEKLLLAIKRMYSIPIQFMGDEIEKENFTKEINKIGLSLQTGGRIMNICDNTNKFKAMSKVIQLINKEVNNNIITIGVGDNHNDLEMIRNADFPCLVRNDNFDSKLINIDNLIRSDEPSPKGWADVIKTALQKI